MSDAAGNQRVAYDGGNYIKVAPEDELEWTVDQAELKKVAGLGVDPIIVVKVNGAKIVVAKGSVIKFRGDAIVNSTNEGLLGGTGVDAAINKAGGEDLVKARRDIPADYTGMRCPTGMAVKTIGGDLDAKYVIHAVGPAYGNSDSKQLVQQNHVLLAGAYGFATKIACESEDIKTVAYCLLCVGTFRGNQSLQKVLSIGFASIGEKITPGMTCYLCGFTPVEAESLKEVAKLYAEGKLNDEEGCCPCTLL